MNHHSEADFDHPHEADSVIRYGELTTFRFMSSTLKETSACAVDGDTSIQKGATSYDEEGITL